MIRTTVAIATIAITRAAVVIRKSTRVLLLQAGIMRVKAVIVIARQRNLTIQRLPLTKATAAATAIITAIIAIARMTRMTVEFSLAMFPVNCRKMTSVS